MYCEVENKECTFKRDICPSYNKKKSVSLIFQVTDRCNEKCPFCWHKNKKELMLQDMDEKNIDDFITFFKEEYMDYYPCITFTGGEPLLNANIIKYAIKKIADNFAYYSFLTITNGLIFPDEEFFELSKKHNMAINISVPRENSEYFYKRLENVKKYIEKSKEQLITFHLTVNKDEHYILHDLLKSWEKVGVSNFNVLFEFDYSEHNELINKEKYVESLKYALNSVKNLENICTNLYTIKGNNYLKDFEDKDKCIKLSYFSNGEFYLTPRDRYTYCEPIGNIRSGIDFNKCINYLKKIPCYGCKYSSQCNGDISAFMYKNKAKLNDKVCYTMKTLIEYNQNKTEEIIDKNPKVILINGPTCIGKSSTCGVLKERLFNSVYIEADAFSKVHPYKYNEDIINSEVFNITYKYIEKDYDYIIIDICTSNEEFLREMKTQYDAIIINLKASKKDHKMRFFERFNNKTLLPFNKLKFENILENLQICNINNTLEVDTTNKKIESIADEIINILQGDK